MRRDQHESAFGRILAELARHIRSARAAALVDVAGETVDYWTSGIEPYALRVAAAQLRLVLEHLRGREAIGRTGLVIQRCARATFVVYGLPEGYAVILWLAPGTGLPASCRRPLSECAWRLAAEAGWASGGIDPWHTVEVRCVGDAPVAVHAGGALIALDVIGRFASGLQPGERAWRVRLPTGAEATIVRSAGRNWYADLPLNRLGAASPSAPAPVPSARGPASASAHAAPAPAPRKLPSDASGKTARA